MLLLPPKLSFLKPRVASPSLPAYLQLREGERLLSSDEHHQISAGFFFHESAHHNFPCVSAIRFNIESRGGFYRSLHGAVGAPERVGIGALSSSHFYLTVSHLEWAKKEYFEYSLSHFF